MGANRGIVGEVEAVNGPVDQFIVVGVQFVGVGAVVVGFTQFNRLHASGEVGPLKGMVEFKFAFWKDGFHAPLLPTRTIGLGGFAAADGDVHGLARRPRTFGVQPEVHVGITETEIADISMSRRDLPHVRGADLFGTRYPPFPAGTGPGGVGRDVGVAKELSELHRNHRHAEAGRELFQSAEQTAHAVGERRAIVGST